MSLRPSLEHHVFDRHEKNNRNKMSNFDPGTMYYSGHIMLNLRTNNLSPKTIHIVRELCR